MTRWQERVRRLVGAWFSFGQASRWIGYGALIGLISGLVACAFFGLLELCKWLVMVKMTGATLAAPAGEMLYPEAGNTPYHAWLFFLLPAIGGLISGLLVYTFAPEAEGHGTDSMVDAFHNKRGVIRTHVPLVKGVATLATLASGGSAGREGPIAQIAGGVGSWFAGILKFSPRERRIMLLAGCAGGLGAIFRAPLGGAIVAIEVLYREDFETEALLPCVISSVTAYALFSSVFGYQRIFEIPPVLFHNPAELVVYAVLGVACVFAGILYVRCFFGVRDILFRPLPVPRHVKPMIAGLMVGAIGIWVPEVYGGGWGAIQHALSSHMAVSTLLLIALAKIVATSLTIGSGGSGGVFGPTLFIGGMLGGAVGVLGQTVWPEVITQPAAFVLVGMSAFFAGVANAPLGALLMTCEMTGGYDLIAPLLLVSAIALVFTRNYSIYENQVRDKFSSPAHIGDMTVDVLASLQVRDAFDPTQELDTVSAEMDFATFREVAANTNATRFPVMRDGKLVGALDLDSARAVVFDPNEDLGHLLLVQDIMTSAAQVMPDDPLHDVLPVIVGKQHSHLVVVMDPDHEGKPLGFLRYQDILNTYRAELLRRTQEADMDGKSRDWKAGDSSVTLPPMVAGIADLHGAAEPADDRNSGTDNEA